MHQAPLEDQPAAEAVGGIEADVGSQAHPDPLGLLRELQADAYHPGHLMVTPQLVRQIRNAGKHVNVWTVNSAERMSELAGWGVSGLITDFPQRWSD